MGYEPITYCRCCEEPFDVYTAPEDRVCDSCKELGLNPHVIEPFRAILNTLVGPKRK